MKKNLKLIVLLVLLLFAFSSLVACSTNNNPEPINNEEPETLKEVSLVFTLKDDDTYEVSGHNNEGKVVVIPEEYNGKPVTSIGDSAIGVNGNENRHFCNIVSVTIPNSIITIGDRAFGECDKLESITIPDSVTSIGEFAFIGNKALTSITIGKGLTSIGDYAFSGCNALERITVDEENTKYKSTNNCLIETETNSLLRGCKNSIIPDDGSVTIIAKGAFNSCKGKASIALPDTVVTIGVAAFAHSEFTSIEIPNSVTTIGGDAFLDSSLTSIDIPNSVTRIGSTPFYGCQNLTSVTIGNGVTFMADNIFTGCTSLERISIDSGNTTYHSYKNCFIHTAQKKLFAACNGFEIPDDGTVTSIAMRAFYNCDKQTKIDIPSYVHEIEGGTFEGCVALEEVSIEGPTSLKQNAFRNLSSLKTVTIGHENSSIGDYAFSGCTSLETVTLQSSIHYISETAFDGCDSLIYNEYSNAYYLGNADNSYIALIKAKSKDIASCTINTNTQLLACGAFKECTALTTISIPSSITRIWDSMFQNCTALQTVSIPSSVTNIGDFVFKDCSSLSVVNYASSQSAWYNTVQKGTNYLAGVSSSCVIRCTNGDIPVGS
ncbi:MAG: leucine-rich repeat domain-containing protein [Clostridiales bacterium]|nr:leucine-rich repeat domain-containing protein [Clostridiales bacterium]